MVTSLTLGVYAVLCFLSHARSFEATELKPCEHQVLKSCLGKFVHAFSDFDRSLTPLEIHCRADMILARCTADSTCNGKAVASLSKALLSYLLFDAKLQVCPRETGVYWKLMGKAGRAPGKSFYQIMKIILSSTPTCARRSDVHCLREYVHLMRTNPDLCVNIPKKYGCLQKQTNICRARILKSLLAVFPVEADSVLHVLCY
ncbi:predicted protein [Nematostella vectensis]|uniref:Uncharacterized protein n=1 Tax=Nematostella vectensis TaxID=45351 RepID=A7T4Y7_NEMVE|nr:predicted protein [Nematostella vectensis]|eukprot:XP_001621075.1 hypothetical protein NEMVEDRAFT_v1g233837 [Nematostella vectensis]